MLKFLIILLVIVFSKFLERCERKNSRVFWPICFMALTVSFSLFDGVSFQKNQNSKIFENNIVSVLARGGGESKGRSGSFVLQTSSRKIKKYNIVFHRRLEIYFPDWGERMAYQETQEKFYKSAQKKRRELKKLRIKETRNFYSKEELNAISYFQGTGFYQKQQDPEVKPNIFDTRQSFLIKMHNPILRNEFLNNFNRKTH